MLRSTLVELYAVAKAGGIADAAYCIRMAIAEIDFVIGHDEKELKAPQTCSPFDLNRVFKGRCND